MLNEPLAILKELQKILSKPRGAEVVQLMAEDKVLDAVLKVQPPLSANGRELRALQRLWSQPEVAGFLEAARPKALPKLEKPRPPNTLFPDPLSNAAPPVVPQPYDFYAVTDFEATCWDGTPNTEMQEIIEFPVVLLNAATGEVVDEFQTFVRPLAQPRLSTFCKRLTGISQEGVDDAPTFKEAAKLLMKWLEEKTSGGSIAWLADGNWDLEIMLPKQWRSAFEIPMPASWKEFIDVRRIFQQVYPSGLRIGPGKLAMMLEFLRVPNVCPVHSGIADARNVARILLALWREGIVCKINHKQQVKRRPFQRADSAKEEVNTSTNSTIAEKFNPFGEAMSLLLARAEDPTGLMTELHFSKGDQKFISGHIPCLGQSPSKDPGAQRRFLVSCGEDFLPAHWRLETAWAEAAEPEDQDALKMIQEAKTAIELLLQDREGYARMQKPFADGKWIQEQTGLDIEEIGPLKEWLFYLQVDENLQSLEEVKAKLKSGWPDLKQVPVVSWPPEKLDIFAKQHSCLPKPLRRIQKTQSTMKRARSA